MALSCKYPPPVTEELAKYSHKVFAVAGGASAELVKLAETQVARINGQIAAFSQIADSDSPFGSRSWTWLMRGIWSASWTDLEADLKALRHAANCGDAYTAALEAAACPSSPAPPHRQPMP